MSFNGFTKLFDGLTESTVWVEPYPTRVLWVAMLSWADQLGRVQGTIPGIARRAGITLEECEAAVQSFMSPDRYSRTPDHEGRRIEKIDGGWRLLNHAKYRGMRDDAERKRYQADWVAEKRRREREIRRQHKSTKVDSRQCRPKSTQAEAEAEAERSSEAKASDASVTPTDPRKQLFDLGVSLLMAQGVGEQQARGFLAKFAKADEKKLAEALGYCSANSKVDVRSYVARVMQPKERRAVV